MPKNRPASSLGKSPPASRRSVLAAMARASAWKRVRRSGALGDAAPPPGEFRFSSETFSVDEGGIAAVTVLRGYGDEGTVGVTVSRVGGGASPDDDFTGLPATLSFGPGVTTRTVLIPTVDDGSHEGPETVALELSDPTGGAILGAPSAATLTLGDNDAAPVPGTIAFASASHAAGEGDTVSVVVRRTGGTAGAVGVTILWSGTATPGEDYTQPEAVVAWEDGDDTPITIEVPILVDDDAGESAETITLTLSSPTGGAALGAVATATITIAADDAEEPEPGAALVAFDASRFAHADGGASFDGADDYFAGANPVGDAASFAVAGYVYRPDASSGGIIWGVSNPDAPTWEARYVYLYPETGLLAVTTVEGSEFATLTSDDAVPVGVWTPFLAEWVDATTAAITIGSAGARKDGAIDDRSPAGLSLMTIGALSVLGAGPHPDLWLRAELDGITAIPGTVDAGERSALLAGHGWDDLPDALRERIESTGGWWGLDESSGPRHDRAAWRHLTPSGDPGRSHSAAHVDPSPASHDGRVARIEGGWTAEGIGPTRDTFPGERLVADADGPGMAAAEPGAPLLRAAFDAYVRVIRTWGVGGRLATCVDGDHVATLDVDAANIVSITRTGPGGTGTITVTDSLYGTVPITGGEGVEGVDTTIIDPDTLETIVVREAATVFIVTSNVRPDSRVGDHVHIDRPGHAIDGDHVLTYSRWDASEGVWTGKFVGPDTTGVGAISPGGTLTLTGWSEDAATDRPTGFARPRPAALRVVGDPVSGRIDCYECHRHLGGGDATGLPSAPGATGTTTVGARLADGAAPTVELPGIVEVYPSELDDDQAHSILARLCCERLGVDDYGGRHATIYVRSWPDIWRDEFVYATWLHRTPAPETPAANAGDVEGYSEGVFSGTPFGDVGQEGITTGDYWLHVASPAWDADGSRPARTVRSVKVAEVVRRPYRRVLECGPGESIDGPLAFSVPGSLIRMAPGLHPATWVVPENAKPPLTIAPAAGESAWEVDYGARLRARDLTVIGMGVLHPSSEATSSGIDPLGAVNLTLIRCNDSATGSTQTSYGVMTTDPATAIAIYDWWLEPTGDPEYAGTISYLFEVLASTWNVILRRVRVGRPHTDGVHTIRLGPTWAAQISGVSWESPTEGNIGAGLSLRGGSRDVTVRCCDMPSRIMGDAGITGDYFDNGEPVIGSGLVVARSRFRQVNGGSVAGRRFTMVRSAAGAFGAFGVPHPQYQEVVPGSSVIEGCVSGEAAAGGAEARAHPTGGNRRNRVAADGEYTIDTGVPLVAPTLVAVDPADLPPGTVGALMDGLPDGGHGLKRCIAHLDGVEQPGWQPELMVFPATAGTHELRVDAADELGNVAAGTPVAVVAR